MQEITKGATKSKVVIMTEALTVTGGNHVNPQITTNGYALTVTGGVLRAPVIDGSRDPADWGANVIITAPLHLTWELREAYQLAVDIRATAEANAGPEGGMIWDKVLDEIFADPDITYQELLDAVGVWADTDPGDGRGVTCTIDFDRAFKRLQARWFPGDGFATIKAALLAKSRETWAGDDTEIVEAYG
jgi:hypothetical protein